MKIYVSDQSKRFDVHLDGHKSLCVIPYERDGLRERVDTLVCATSKRLHELDLDFLFDYRVFPENILTSGCSWRSEGRSMRFGDTILQQINIPPLQRASLKILVATRVCEVVDLPYRKSFSYETLQGHVEKGVSTFSVEQKDHGVMVSIRTFSDSGTLLTKLAAPFMTRPYQAYCTKLALKTMQQHVDQQ